MRKLVLSALLALVLVLSGCASVELDEKWWPLRFVKQSKVLALSTAARTIGDSMYVSDTDAWMDSHPEPKRSASYAHERVHSIRQKFYEGPGGRWGWIGKWLTDKDFMLVEEQYGYYYQIKYLREHGVQIVVPSWAKILTKYFGIVGHMLSEEDAAIWLQQVVSGTWHPPAEVRAQIQNPGQ